MRSHVRSAALVEAWFDVLPPQQIALARALQSALTDAVPRFAQAVRWGNLVFMLDDVAVLSIVPHRTHLRLQVSNGVALLPQFPQLEGASKGPRHLKLRPDQALDVPSIQALARASVGTIPGS